MDSDADDATHNCTGHIIGQNSLDDRLSIIAIVHI